VSTNTLVLATKALLGFLDHAVARPLEPVRVARTTFALLFAGCEPTTSLFQRTTDFISQVQRSDGGWADPIETAWAVSVISGVRGATDSSVQASLAWLRSVRRKGGGWGLHDRDQSRIPVTGLVGLLAPAVISDEDRRWVEEEWRRDFSGTPRLSYKAGFYLLVAATDSQQRDADQVTLTLEHLTADQNDDGGFGPWRGHPIGSDPWSTGVALLGLSCWFNQVDFRVFQKALEWLERTQLPTGFWPYHYLDDGTSLGLIGAICALKALDGKRPV
jgi:hypothetical protein